MIRPAGASTVQTTVHPALSRFRHSEPLRAAIRAAEVPLPRMGMSALAAQAAQISEELLLP